MSTIGPGFTFSNGVFEQVTNTALHQLVDNAIVTAIPASEFTTGSKVVQIAASIPASDQGEGSLWFDTTLMILRTKNSTRWDAQAVGPELLNGSGATIGAGILVVGNATSSMNPCLTAAWPEVVGATVGVVNPGATGVVRKGGIGLLALIGPCTVGDTLVAAGSYTTSAVGRARSARAAGTTTVTAGIEVGICMTQIAAVTALATCLVWR